LKVYTVWQSDYTPLVFWPEGAQDLLKKYIDPRVRRFTELIGKVRVGIFADQEICCAINTWIDPERPIIGFLLLSTDEAEKSELDGWPPILTSAKGIDLNGLEEIFNEAELKDFIEAVINNHLEEEIDEIQKRINWLKEVKAGIG
jgi:hypothetical protein